jgi:hypothetical protein
VHQRQTPILPALPTPGAPNPARHGQPRLTIEHLRGRQPVKGEKVPAAFGFDSVAESKPETAKGET